MKLFFYIILNSNQLMIRTVCLARNRLRHRAQIMSFVNYNDYNVKN